VGRISADLTSPADVEFVREKLDKMDQGDFIRLCVATRRQFEAGELISKDLLENEIKATILGALSTAGNIRNVAISEPVATVPQPADRDGKDDALPANVIEKVNDQVKSSSLLNQLQDKMKQGTLGPKPNGE
jgi:hypothetical protein